MKRTAHQIAPLLLVTMMLASGLSFAFQDQDVEIRPGDTVDWHVIQEGETLINITAKYLGIGSLWRENLRLNPNITDPRRLRPGMRIRVIINRELPPSTAEVIQVKRMVEHRQEPQTWQPTHVGNRLKEKNTVRTAANSSAELRFDDNSRLNITEESMVFLERVGTTLRGINRQAVEIKQGQADLFAQLARPDRSDIEILVGDVVAQPKVDANGVARTRSRLQTSGNAEVMVYNGQTDVAAAGARVSVPPGMGTVVEPGQAPQPPEKLLPKVGLNAPARNAQLAFANPVLRWQAVNNAVSYTLEICEDADCSALILRESGLTETQLAVDPLPVQSLYWRVTATATSGLDGFPGNTRALVITSDQIDRVAPFCTAYIVGLGIAQAADQVILGQGGGLALAATDDVAGVARIEYRWNSNPWQTYSGDVLTLPENVDQAALAFRAWDHLDREGTTQELRVSRDTKAPAAPALDKP